MLPPMTDVTQWDDKGLHLEVFTFKEGLLSKVAHDLRLVAEALSATLEGDAVHVEVDLSGLRVASARKNGKDDHGTLSAGDKTKIRDAMRKEVLHTSRHPNAVFDGQVLDRTEKSARVRGELALHGKTRPLEFGLSHEGTQWVGEFELHQPDFGITPYSAMLGALKVKADVRVRVSVDVRD